jgi:hypothetical protein
MKWGSLYLEEMDLKIQISIGLCVKPYGILRVSPMNLSREPSLSLHYGTTHWAGTELKEIKQKVAEPVWEFDQRFKTLIGRLNFHILDEQNKEWFITVMLPHIRFPLMQQKIASQEEALDITMKLESTPMGESSSCMS